MTDDTLPSQDPRDDIVLYIPDLRAFAISLTRQHDLADDLVQDTITRLGPT